MIYITVDNISVMCVTTYRCVSDGFHHSPQSGEVGFAQVDDKEVQRMEVDKILSLKIVETVGSLCTAPQTDSLDRKTGKT